MPNQTDRNLDGVVALNAMSIVLLLRKAAIRLLLISHLE